MAVTLSIALQKSVNWDLVTKIKYLQYFIPSSTLNWNECGHTLLLGWWRFLQHRDWSTTQVNSHHGEGTLRQVFICCIGERIDIRAGGTWLHSFSMESDHSQSSHSSRMSITSGMMRAIFGFITAIEYFDLKTNLHFRTCDGDVNILLLVRRPTFISGGLDSISGLSAWPSVVILLGCPRSITVIMVGALSPAANKVMVWVTHLLRYVY